MRLGLMYLRIPSLDRGVKAAPSGVAYLASYLKQYNGMEDIYIEEYFDKLMAKKPDIVGISAVSEMYPKAREIARRIKEWNPKVKIIVGGPHITALPQTLDSNMDAGVISEGEEQFAEVVKLITNNDFDPDKLKDITGIVYRNEANEIVETGKRPWLQNIDLIPPPDRKLISQISVSHRDGPYQQSILTERGCPFKCEYCSATAFWDKMRTHSIERVMSEIEYIIKNHPDQVSISISDDLFGLNRKRLRQMVDLIKSEGYHKKVNFVCQTRASCFNEDVAQMFAEMNMRAACFGFESANDRVLKFLKGAGKNSDNQRAIDLCSKYGIEIVANFIIGSPTETESEMADTYWFIRKNSDKLVRMNASTATPFPGTKWWQYVKESKLVDDNFDDWESLDLKFDKDRTIFMNNEVDKDKYADILATFRKVGDEKHVTAISEAEFIVSFKEYYRQQYEYIAKLLDKPDTKILEVSGVHHQFKDFVKNATVDRVEISKNSAEITGNDYDHVFLPYSLEMMRNPQDFLNSLKDKVKDNAKIFIINHNIANISVFYNLLANKWQTSPIGLNKKENISFFSIRTIYDLLTKSGFTDLQFEKAPQPQKMYEPGYNLLLSNLSKSPALHHHMIDRDIPAFMTVCSIPVMAKQKDDTRITASVT